MGAFSLIVVINLLNRYLFVLQMKPRRCRVCKLTVSKYKCPQCFTPYCSVACNKTHKPACIPVVQPAAAMVKNEPKVPLPERLTYGPDEDHFDSDSPDFVPLEKLRQLEHNMVLKNLLKDRHLIEMIEKCNRAENKSEEIAKLMKNDLFVQFANVCLETVDVDNYEPLPNF